MTRKRCMGMAKWSGHMVLPTQVWLHLFCIVHTDCTLNVLTGDWREGRMHGKGECHWVEGKSYRGDWANGAMHGKGVFISFNGDRFYGSFVKGKRHGIGTLYSAEGKLIEKSSWKHGKRVRKDQEEMRVKKYHYKTTKPTMF